MQGDGLMSESLRIGDIRIAQEVWQRKYRFCRADGTVVDKTVDDTFKRVAKALAKAEKGAARAKWARAFHEVMADYRFLPAGRILAGAGTGRAVTLFNCFVMGEIDDSLSGIFDELKNAALTMQQGGGIGQDFSTIRPAGAPVEGAGADASGPLSFMDMWDAMCRTIMSAGSRRGAMMATLRCDHPDIEAFIEAKRKGGRFAMFNLSVLISDAFMQALKAGADWPLVFGGRVFRTVKAQDLWDKIMRANYDSAEPGVIFIDRINALNNLSWAETIHATNPCGEQPLPPYGACLLGSLNLTQFVAGPFGEGARLDEELLRKTVTVAVRMLDNAIDVSHYPLKAQAREARSKRRIGLGLTGLGDALAMCRVRYGSKEAVRLAGQWMKTIRDAAYMASADLAGEKGAFEIHDEKAFLAAPGVAALPEAVRRKIAANGIRNGLLTSIAPAGTMPVFAASYERKILNDDGSQARQTVSDYAVALYRAKSGDAGPLPEYFVTAHELHPQEHLAMQAALQPFVDSAISKTINCDEHISFEEFSGIYRQAYDLGLKGCTTYRPNEVTGSVLDVAGAGREPEREAQAVLPLEAPVRREEDGAVVYMKQPLERHESLPGFTYKLKWPDSSHAIYITVNDIIQGGRRRPFEVFINSKNMEHYAWTVALTRMISAVFRRGGDVSFVVEELKAVFDPRGGQWMDGKYVPSLLAAIGGVIERHMIDTGFLSAGGGDKKSREEVRLAAGDERRAGRQCRECGEAALTFQEGCETCMACGYSKCE